VAVLRGADVVGRAVDDVERGRDGSGEGGGRLRATALPAGRGATVAVVEFTLGGVVVDVAYVRRSWSSRDRSTPAASKLSRSSKWSRR